MATNYATSLPMEISINEPEDVKKLLKPVGVGSEASAPETREQEYRDALQDRKRELVALGLKAGATFIPSLDGFAISEGDLKTVTSELDRVRKERDELLATLKDAASDYIKTGKISVPAIRAAIAEAEGRAE